MNLKLKEKKCRQCKEKFLPVRTLQMVCTLSCAMKYAKVKEEEKDRKAWIKRKKDLREKLKTLGEYEKEAKAVFQKWIRQRDKKLPCISCGKVAENYDGGHFSRQNFTLD
jgi:predicted amidophosphoribosyltransferase